MISVEGFQQPMRQVVLQKLGKRALQNIPSRASKVDLASLRVKVKLSVIETYWTPGTHPSGRC